MKPILIATDRSETADEATGKAIELASALQAPLELELDVRSDEQPRRLVCADVVTAALAKRRD